MLRSFLEKEFMNFMKDISSLGDTLILIFLIFLITGLSSKFYFIIIMLILIDIVGNLIKVIYFKERPLKEDHKNILEKMNAGSFPSLHSARGIFVALTLWNFNNLLLSITLSVLALLIGMSRIILKKHRMIDVSFGYFLGLIFYFIWRYIFGNL